MKQLILTRKFLQKFCSMPILLMFLLLTICPITLSGQWPGRSEYIIKKYTTEQGLPHNDVRAIAQDQQGFIWIATWDGLSRYDGYESHIYYFLHNFLQIFLYF